MASSKASMVACVMSASTSTCSPPSAKHNGSSKNGGRTTTPTDRTRASMGSHQPSSQHAPRRGKTGTDSPYKRGQVGEQVKLGQLELLYGDWKCGQTVTSYVVGLLDPVISANVPQQLKDLDTGLHSSLATFIQPGPNQPSNGCTNPLPLLETNLGVGATRPPSNALGPTNALNSATSV